MDTPIQVGSGSNCTAQRHRGLLMTGPWQRLIRTSAMTGSATILVRSASEQSRSAVNQSPLCGCGVQTGRLHHKMQTLPQFIFYSFEYFMSTSSSPRKRFLIKRPTCLRSDFSSAGIKKKGSDSGTRCKLSLQYAAIALGTLAIPKAIEIVIFFGLGTRMSWLGLGCRTKKKDNIRL